MTVALLPGHSWAPAHPQRVCHGFWKRLWILATMLAGEFLLPECFLFATCTLNKGLFGAANYSGVCV